MPLFYAFHHCFFEKDLFELNGGYFHKSNFDAFSLTMLPWFAHIGVVFLQVDEI